MVIGVSYSRGADNQSGGKDCQNLCRKQGIFSTNKGEKKRKISDMTSRRLFLVPGSQKLSKREGRRKKKKNIKKP